MKILFCILLLSLLIAPCAMAQEAYLGWFTDASITSSTKMTAPTGAPALVPNGTIGTCLDLTGSVGVTDSLLIQTRGIISFWLKPKWEGNDGLTHKLLTCGTTSEGLLIDKTPAGNIRFRMSGGGKTTAIRYDVNGWHAGEWHHVMVGWMDYNNAALGLAMWIDRVPTSCVYGGTRFFSPPYDKKVYLGDTTSQAYMDELIFRNSFSATTASGATPIDYRDYFRTAPYTSIEITHKAQKVNADTRVVAGYKKQFGVIATRIVNGDTGTTTTEYITDNDGPVGSTWDTFDAKANITWTSSSTSKATVNSNGMVTGVATTTTPITLTANFRGMIATYPITVVSANQPDLDVMYVERTPRYHSLATKNWPAVNDTVTSIAHIGNYGYQPITGFRLKFELIPDTNVNFVLDPGETPTTTVTRDVATTLQPGTQTTESFSWTWPAGQVFVRVTVDPDDTVSEICEANNQRCEINKARAVRWGYGYDPDGLGNSDYNFVQDYSNKVINLVGSFSDYDWCNANTDRMGLMLRESIWPTTSPIGIQDTVRADDFQTVDTYLADHNDPLGPLHDGGFEIMWDSRIALSPGNIHEMGHNVLKLPDMYGHGLSTKSMLFSDENGKSYGATPLIPITDGNWTAPWSSATWGYPDSLGIGYNPLMVNNHPWLDKDLAAWVQFTKGTRKGVSDSDWGTKIPSTNTLKLRDVDDNPLANARVYIYQCTNTGYMMADNKFYPGRPKFVGYTDASGLYVIPKTTSTYWDDWTTDTNDGAVTASLPFNKSGTQKAWGPSWMVGEMLLLRIVGNNGQTEFQTLPLSEFHIAYFSGNTANATYTINTSLTSPSVVPDVVAPIIPAAGKKPTARVKYNGVSYSGNFTITIPFSATQSTTIKLDGTVSTDNENQPLFYHWDTQWGCSWGPIKQVTIPANQGVGDYRFAFYCIDGVRPSDLIEITVKIVSTTTAKITGHLTDQNGANVGSATVGIKKSARATADADYYVTTNSLGNFTSPSLPAGTYYLAAWKSGWTPTPDSTVTLGTTDQTANLQFADTSGTRVIVPYVNVAASDTASSYGTNKAVDSSTSTGWATNSDPAEPVYYYIDLGGLTDVTWMSIFRYYATADHEATYDTYTVDVMSAGSPLDPASWQGNSTVRTVYSAENTLHGYVYSTNVAHDPIKLDALGINGIRISMKNIDWVKYEIREIYLYTNNPAMKLPSLKTLPLDTPCKISYKELTAVPAAGVPPGIFYVQETDRSTGMRIDLSAVPLPGAKAGDKLSVSGTIKETAAGERYVLATSRNLVTSTATIKPVGMNNKAVLTGTLARSILAKIWGRVESVGTDYFIISTDEMTQVKVTCGSYAKPDEGKLVAVTGIVSNDGSPTLLMTLAGWTPLAP